MTFDFKVTNIDYQDRIGVLDKEAKGVVKSKKNFPIFLINEQEMIFKPLSKTKPFSTPYFAYSEVVWSTIINRYFDSKTPIYKLAICHNCREYCQTKYNHGTIVNSLNKETRQILNLYEILLKNKEEVIDFDYINYCEKFYDFTSILEAKLINNNGTIGEELAFQILLSILKLDQNYHYENPLFYEENGIIKSLTPSIDHEFSTMFMFLDDLEKHKLKYQYTIDLLQLKINPKDMLGKLRYEAFGVIAKNLDKICLKYPHIAKYFLKQLQILEQDLEKEPLKLEDYDYIKPFNSYNFLIGEARYKKNNELEARNLEQTLENIKPDINIISEIIQSEILDTCKILKRELTRRLD